MAALARVASSRSKTRRTRRTASLSMASGWGRCSMHQAFRFSSSTPANRPLRRRRPRRMRPGPKRRARRSQPTFTDDERKVLALLHLFQGVVDVDALRGMGRPEAEWCLAAVRGLTRERGIALLDRAAEIGLLRAHGDGYYGIHPALPWYFRALFARDFPEDSGDASRARRAFVEAMGVLSNIYHNTYQDGRREVLSAVMAEEDNLLAACDLAHAHGWWHALTSAMQDLDTLYHATGRR